MTTHTKLANHQQPQETVPAVVLQRRVLIGVLGTAVLGAFALVPLEGLQSKPSKPLFYYLTPLIRVQVRRLRVHTSYCGCKRGVHFTDVHALTVRVHRRC